MVRLKGDEADTAAGLQAAGLWEGGLSSRYGSGVAVPSKGGRSWGQGGGGRLPRGQKLTEDLTG